MESRKNLLPVLGVVLFICFCFAIASCVHDTNNAARADSDNIRVTVEQSQKDSQRAADEIGTAQQQLSSGQETLGRAESTVEDLRESNQSSADLIDQCADLLDELDRQLGEIGNSGK